MILQVTDLVEIIKTIGESLNLCLRTILIFSHSSFKLS